MNLTSQNARLCFFCIACLISCDNRSDTIGIDSSETMFTLLPKEQTGISFANEISSHQNFNILTYRNYYNGGGVAIGDVNNDGLNDIFFTANLQPNRLYLNKGYFKFEDVTQSAGVKGTGSWSTGTTFADVNGDGRIDIYVCNSGDLDGTNRDNELFINNGDGTFTERAAEYGLNDNGYSTHAAFFDYDQDGDLDCFILNNSYTDPQRIATVSRSRNNFGSPGGDRLYRNDGSSFTDVTGPAGIYSGDIGFGLGVSVGDVNNDNLPDIYISNDFWERDYFYLNNGDGTFNEKLTDNFSYVSANSMGSDIADINNDGYNDIFSTDMLPSSNYRMKAALMIEEYYLEDVKWKNSYFFQYIQNALQVNNGNGTFRETAFYSGIASTDWSWGALIFDIDNDGLKDIFVSNGIYHDITDLDFVDFISDKKEVRKVVERTGRSDFRDFLEYLPHNKQSNFAFINQGNLRFKDGAANLGLAEPSFSNGSAYGDLDNDGDYDLVINNVNMDAFIYKNNGNGGNFIKVKLKGDRLNTAALGTKVFLYDGGGVQMMESYTARGFQSSVDPDLIFGLGSSTEIDSLVVTWPDGKSQLVLGDTLEVNSTVQISPAHGRVIRNRPAASSPLFRNNSERFFGEIPKHNENSYQDFDHERLIPHASSTEGPRIIKGDVDGDGHEDVILLGASGQADQLFLARNGRLHKMYQSSFMVDKEFESVCGSLFDADNDGDLDYVVGSGGNEYQKGISNFVSRFYVNDGKGNFTRMNDRGPQFAGQVSCIKPSDFDNDGDVDLFVGGAGIPGNYGMTPRSFLLRNDGNNNWVDITTEETGPLGMVRDAVWTDLNDDNIDDLIVVGEWMPVTIFVAHGGNLRKQGELPDSHGWWTRIEMSDLDGDGDDDFVLGNWGENMKLQASKERPLKLYVNDFDGNGKNEPILEWFFGTDERPYPFASKKDLTAQLPMLKKKSLRYQEYAKKGVSEIIPADKLSESLQLMATEFRSCVLLRNGDDFELSPLPVEAQLSPVFGLAIADIDGDKIPDVLFGGNYYKLKPEIGRLDGSNGGYLKGRGDGTFVFVSAEASGIRLLGQVRDIAISGSNILFARNNEQIISFVRR